jgi:hypothetical protein
MTSFPQINKIWHFLASRVFSGNSKWGIRIAEKNFFPFRKVSLGEEIPTSSFVFWLSLFWEALSMKQPKFSWGGSNWENLEFFALKLNVTKRGQKFRLCPS